MCGISGFITQSWNSDFEHVGKLMSDTLVHRGPDSYGAWSDRENGVHLSHQRLSIIELSNMGNQPMKSHCNRFVMVFNGEIYNHLELRTNLNRDGFSHNWRGGSDTETLLACFSFWGLDKTLSVISGMFSIALWDNENKSLTLIRDRMGEKPLYYGWVNFKSRKTLIFGSELKALLKFPGFRGVIDPCALSKYFQFGYVPSPMSIYKDVFKLTPGSCITIAKNSLDIGRKKYWSLSEVAENGLLNPIKDSEEAIYSVEEALKKSINLQSVSDVPLGAFLSGGIDSTLISTLMQHNSQTPIRTFSVGFEEDGFDESYHAGVVANLLGTEHNKIIVNSKDALEIIPKLPELYDEPFADSSQIPTFLISQVARQHVKVVLSGDAGDELFGGYNRYIWAPFFWSKVSLFPQVIRDSVANILDAIPSRLWNSILSGHVAHPNDKIQKLILILKTSSNIDDVYQSLISIWSLYDSPNRCNNQYDINIHPPSCIKDPKLRMMYADSRGYLPDDILTKVDRASMGVSLETRVPFLDYQLVELSWRIPLDYKIRNNKGKWILRQIIDKYIPYGMHNKPKTGFSIPLGAWLRGPLKDWSNDLLNSYISNSDEHSRNKKIQAMWAAHLGQKHDFSRQLWVVLMFESWRNGKDVK